MDLACRRRSGGGGDRVTLRAQAPSSARARWVMSSGCWLHVCGSLLLDLSVFVYAVLHVAAHPGSSGDLAEKQSLRSGLDPGCTRAAHCEAGDAPADFTQLRAGHVSPAQGSPRLQGRSPAAADSLSCDARAAKRRRRRGGESCAL
ncbi:unnamed protein product [Pleuronectes platessa]|uniref:Uncharacterized protein n=1 Tax=Pleuronectes platessa TaxID=8262 RepID=A0A9N7UXL4_PLEPL|nr:unnamed protein product [Pleuronectes platessa]